MKKQDVLQILREVERGSVSAEEAFTRLKLAPFEDIGFAKVDHHREMRQGVAEVIYGQGKTPEQIAKISETLLRGGDRVVLITRMSPEAAAYVGEKFPLVYDSLSKVGRIGDMPEPDGVGTVLVATGGTTDIPVAEEAALTAEALGNRVKRLYDVGVSGIHRLLDHAEDIMTRAGASWPWRAWRARCRASSAGWRTARSSRCPPAWATARPSAALRRCFRC